MNLKNYQLDDLARLSLLDGAILGWETGLGKTLALFIWPLMKCGWSAWSLRNGVWQKQLKVHGPVLIVSPEVLHAQTQEDGKRLLGVETHPIVGVDLSKPVPPGFYISSYTRLKDVPSDAFLAVVVDEGDKSKKTGSSAGFQVRRLKPKYRLIATATPMADRLPDLFWLCSWVCENDPKDKERFPYDPTQEELKEFGERFLCSSDNLTRGDDERQVRERCTDVQRLFELWRILSGIILRRRMDDTGEEVVGIQHRIIPCPLTVEQKAAYQRALFASGDDVGIRLGHLRRIAGGAAWPNPKLATALELIANVLGRKQQVLVASDFRGPTDALSARLADAGIPHVVMDGRTAPRARADVAQAFKEGRYPVALIGLKSGAEGMSYPKCNNLILLNYSWEYKKLPQVIGRARRINSERDLEVWSLVSEGTIETRMAQLVVEEKGSAADLVLDGIWPRARGEEINWLELATKEFCPSQKATSQWELEQQWSGLRERLRQVYEPANVCNLGGVLARCA